MLLHSSADAGGSRYAFVTARPFLTFRSIGTRCEMETPSGRQTLFGNPWQVLDRWMARYEILDEPPMAFPLGGCFGYWGYDLKRFVEPNLNPRAVVDLELPDCQVGFYHSLVAFEEGTGRAWVIATGLDADGGRDPARAAEQAAFWSERLASQPVEPAPDDLQAGAVRSTFSREGFQAAVVRAQAYIRAGDIYQVNLSQRFSASWNGDGWALYRRLAEASPAPFAAFLDAGEFSLASSSPELFLRLSGPSILTRPIKGTRPRSMDPAADAAYSAELQQSAKERAELVMITDLLRNDLGKVCRFGTVRVPELARLERFAQVQHLVSTVVGELRPEVTHFSALASCFPGGSITGAPKFRAMQIIDQLEPVARGPYTGCLGYLGFNREGQFSILIRTAICEPGRVWWHAGAGIVADSDPELEYEETLAKGEGVLAALGLRPEGALRQDPAQSENGCW